MFDLTIDQWDRVSGGADTDGPDIVVTGHRLADEFSGWADNLDYVGGYLGAASFGLGIAAAGQAGLDLPVDVAAGVTATAAVATFATARVLNGLSSAINYACQP